VYFTNVPPPDSERVPRRSAKSFETGGSSAAAAAAAVLDAE